MLDLTAGISVIIGVGAALFAHGHVLAAEPEYSRAADRLVKPPINWLLLAADLAAIVQGVVLYGLAAVIGLLDDIR